MYSVYIWRYDWWKISTNVNIRCYILTVIYTAFQGRTCVYFLPIEWYSLERRTNVTLGAEGGQTRAGIQRPHQDTVPPAIVVSSDRSITSQWVLEKFPFLLITPSPLSPLVLHGLLRNTARCNVPLSSYNIHCGRVGVFYFCHFSSCTILFTIVTLEEILCLYILLRQVAFFMFLYGLDKQYLWLYVNWGIPGVLLGLPLTY